MTIGVVTKTKSGLTGRIINKSMITFLVVAGMLLAFSTTSHAAKMFLEYQGELNSNYTFYRGAFDLADINHDGSAELVIADDMGGFQVYRFTSGGFVPLWISDPIINDGFIVDVQVVDANSRKVMPTLRLLDSVGTLHKIGYSGYLFEEAGKVENYKVPVDSGRLILAKAEKNTYKVLIAAKSDNGKGIKPAVNSPFSDLSPAIAYRIASSGPVELTKDELAKLDQGGVFFVQNLTSDQIKNLQNLGKAGKQGFLASGAGSHRVGIADLDHDSNLEVIIAYSDLKRPVDRLEIYTDSKGSYVLKQAIELPPMNQIRLGDIDGDGNIEIVGLTFDGGVLVYQWDPLVVKTATGAEISWDAPHKDINGTIWMSLSGFVALGCKAQDDTRYLIVSKGDRFVTLDRVDGRIMCGNDILLPDIPSEMLDRTQFLPLFAVLDCLGFLYTYDPSKNLVQLENAG